MKRTIGLVMMGAGLTIMARGAVDIAIENEKMKKQLKKNAKEFKEMEKDLIEIANLMGVDISDLMDDEQ